MPTTRRESPASWMRRAETRTLDGSEPLLAEAIANTRRVQDDRGFLLRLAREVIAARGAELTRRHHNLVRLVPGLRQTRADGGGSQLHDELCIVFLVRRKWSPGCPGAAAQALPAWLLAHAEHGGQREVFALPTDVQRAAPLARLRAHAQSALWLDQGAGFTANGAFTCVVRLQQPGAAPRNCLLGAHHVFTPCEDGDALGVAAGLGVRPLTPQGARAAAPRLATTLPVGGWLRANAPPGLPSFDTQLAGIDAAAGAQVRARLPFTKFWPGLPWVRSGGELLALNAQFDLLLLTPDNHREQPGRGAIRLKVARMPEPGSPDELEYTLVSGGVAQAVRVYHRDLWHLAARAGGPVPRPGDSGSPVVIGRAGGAVTLVGMHIGGDGRGLSLVIPSWILLDLARWDQRAPGATITPVSP